MSHEQILVIEDDEDIQILIRHNLVKEEYMVSVVGSAEEGLAMLLQQSFDCVLLDLMLPGMDGLELCKRLKRHQKTQHVPIIMVTAKGEESDIVAGLELGAEDYIIKPFSPRVLIARVRATLRRKSREYTKSEVLTVNEMEIHPGRHDVAIQGKRIDLTPMEFQVLHLLASQPGWVFTRNQIIENAREDNYPVTDRSIDVVIVGLRHKLGAAADCIETVRGVGYRFAE